jgi:hypothetical protein
MTHMTTRALAVLVCSGVLAIALPRGAAAQDLFELEVFEFETVPAGDVDVELHTNVMSRGSVAPSATTQNHRPMHLSVEAARGWTERFETALFVQTAPFGADGSAWFAGGHVRGKVRLGELPAIPIRLAASAEYAFNRSAFDQELQTLEVRAIVDYVQGRLALVANPSLEIVTRGGPGGLEPVVDVSARAAWTVGTRVTVAADYFSAAATVRHLQPEPTAHHLVFAGVELDLGDGWELGVSAGHCVTSAEPWVVRSVMGFRF